MRPATSLLALALAAGLGAPARADGKLPPDRQAEVEAVLRRQGFTAWQAIEVDDGMIEVDDAVDAGGRQFDLKLDPETLAVVAREAE